MTDLNRRHLGMIALGVAVSATAGAGCATSDPDGGADPYALVDPELVAALKAQPTVDLSALMLPLARLAPSQLTILPPPAPAPAERSIPGPHGKPLKIFVTDPAPGTRGRAGVLHIHSGGFILGSAEAEAPLAQTIAKELGHVVVSIDYSLAPQARFPVALEENLAALQWMRDNADELGIDRARIGLFGVSGGGGHAAMLAIAARDGRGPPIRCLVMNYPMLDDRTGSSREVPPHIGRFVWTRASNRLGWSSLLGQPAGETTVPTGSVPARVENLAGLPRTYIGVGAIDLFVEESVSFATRLISAGVPTELLVIPGAPHGFDLGVPDAAISKRFIASWLGALRTGLAPAG